MKIDIYITLDRMLDAFEDMAERYEYEDELIKNSSYLTRKKICAMYTTLYCMKNTAYRCWKESDK